MILGLNLEKIIFKLMQNITSELQFNGFLFSGRVVSRFLWWHSHHCLCLVLWMFYLFCLMVYAYLSQGLRAAFFYTGLTLWRFLLGKLAELSMALWCVQWHQMTPSYLLCCLVDVQCNVSILFFDSLIYLPLHEQSHWYTPGWLLGSSYGLFDIGCFESSCQMWN